MTIKEKIYTKYKYNPRQRRKHKGNYYMHAQLDSEKEPNYSSTNKNSNSSSISQQRLCDVVLKTINMYHNSALKASETVPSPLHMNEALISVVFYLASKLTKSSPSGISLGKAKGGRCTKNQALVLKYFQCYFLSYLFYQIKSDGHC